MAMIIIIKYQCCDDTQDLIPGSTEGRYCQKDIEQHWVVGLLVVFFLSITPLVTKSQNVEDCILHFAHLCVYMDLHSRNFQQGEDHDKQERGRTSANWRYRIQNFKWIYSWRDLGMENPQYDNDIWRRVDYTNTFVSDSILPNVQHNR